MALLVVTVALLSVFGQAAALPVNCTGGRVYASCNLMPDPNSAVPGVRGTVDFVQRVDDNCLKVGPTFFDVRVTGLPAGDSTVQHGFHIHTYGDITGGCGTAGGHYNPLGQNHGAPFDIIRHVGDMGNMDEEADGSITHLGSDIVVNLVGNDSVIGLTVVLHELRDDLGLGGDASSLVTGNAGSRLACCVIGWADGSRWTRK